MDNYSFMVEIIFGKEEVGIVKRRIFITAIIGSLFCCLSGCQHKTSENYNIMLNSKSDVLPIYAENAKEISNKTFDLASLEDIDAPFCSGFQHLIGISCALARSTSNFPLREISSE